MKVLLGVEQVSETTTGGFNYAFVEVTQETAGVVLGRVRQLREASNEDESLVEMVFEDSTPTFFNWHSSLNDRFLKNSDFVDSELDTILENIGWADVKDSFRVPLRHISRVKDVRMVVGFDRRGGETYVMWRGLANLGFPVETARMGLGVFRKVAEGIEVKAGI